MSKNYIAIEITEDDLKKMETKMKEEGIKTRSQYLYLLLIRDLKK